MSRLVISLLLASAVSAKVFPRAELSAPASSKASSKVSSKASSKSASKASTRSSISVSTPSPTPSEIPANRTLTIPFPTGADPFSTEIPGCTLADGTGETVAPIVVIGDPTGTFQEQVLTIYLPPQAQETAITFTDPEGSEATEVVICSTLPGVCQDVPFPTPIESTSPTPSDGSDGPVETELPGVPENLAKKLSPARRDDQSSSCPSGTCSGELVEGANLIIEAINDVSYLSFNLQATARRIGEQSSFFGIPFDKTEKRTDAQKETINPFIITDAANGLREIVQRLTEALPSITVIDPFPPGCDTDTIVISFIKFVEIHQALLNIFIGRSGYLSQIPFKREASARTDVQLNERAENGFIGQSIALALRAVERVVDTLASTLINLIPTRSECARSEKAKLSATLKRSISAYES